jgi:pSer/pThr/pTyr-binding forkhead associated (FHA) protein
VRLRIQVPEGTSEWETDAAVFRVGRADTCALRFEGELAKYASWWHAEFSVDNRGVNYVTDLGSSNGTYVNGERISERTPLAVGVTVHIGSKGPRLDVLELSPPTPRGTVSPVSAPVAPAMASSAAGPATWLQRHGLAVGLAIALMAVVAVVVLRRDATPDRNPEQSAVNQKDKEDADQAEPPANKRGDPPVEPDKPSDTSVQTTESPDEKESKPTVGPPKPAQDALQAFAAYRLIVAEDPQSHDKHPGPGAIVVADRTLLTTATLAVELAKMADKDYALKAVNPADGTSVAIRDLRVHPLFQKRDPAEQLFFDAALLYTDGRLTNVAELATADELEQLVLARPLTCIAADHGRVPLELVEELAPAAHQGIILETNFLQGQPRARGVPRVLTVYGRFENWYFGSPIINSRGHVVAMYCEPTAEDGADTHFATVIDPELIKGGLNQPDSSFWVPITTASKTKEPEK